MKVSEWNVNYILLFININVVFVEFGKGSRDETVKFEYLLEHRGYRAQ